MTLVESSPMAVYETDQQGNCLYVNQKWRDMAGLNLKEALGSGWKKGLHVKDRDRIFQQWNKNSQLQNS